MEAFSQAPAFQLCDWFLLGILSALVPEILLSLLSKALCPHPLLGLPLHPRPFSTDLRPAGLCLDTSTRWATGASDPPRPLPRQTDTVSSGDQTRKRD